MSYWNLKYKTWKRGSFRKATWSLFPYKSLKSEIALTLKVLLLWLSNCRKLLIFGCSSTWCKLFTLFMFVYNKNKDTPLWIGSIRIKCFEENRHEVSCSSTSTTLPTLNIKLTCDGKQTFHSHDLCRHNLELDTYM